MSDLNPIGRHARRSSDRVSAPGKRRAAAPARLWFRSSTRSRGAARSALPTLHPRKPGRLRSPSRTAPREPVPVTVAIAVPRSRLSSLRALGTLVHGGLLLLLSPIFRSGEQRISTVFRTPPQPAQAREDQRQFHRHGFRTTGAGTNCLWHFAEEGSRTLRGRCARV